MTVATGSASRRQVLGTCHHDCPDSCGWVVTVEGGVATKLRGNPAHPFSQGELCPKVNRFLDRVYSPERLLQPLRRVGPKGSGQFEPVSWTEALSVIAREMTTRIDRYGGETVLTHSDAGNQSALSIGSLSERFLARVGATRSLGSVCGAVVRAGAEATNGTGRAIDPADIRHSKLILLWGTNTRLTNRHLWPFIQEAKDAGAHVVVIDPIRTATAEAADRFVQPLPGTDAALALAMMHVLVRDDLIDHDYVSRHTHGFEELAVRVEAWSPSRAADVCGLTVTEIEELAHLYGTVRPSVIRTLIGAEHREHGAMLHRTLACLPALVGAWRDRGGGYSRSTSAWFDHEVDMVALSRFPAETRPTGSRRGININHDARALTDLTLDPPVTVFLSWNGNPLVSQPNTELMRRGLERDDLFTVVHEQFLTDTARYADIVLPATTQLEQLDVVPAWGHLYLGWNEKAIEPLGEAVSNTELFRRLSAALGYTEPELFVDDETLLAEALHRLSAERLRQLRSDGFVRLDLPDDLRPFADGSFPTPSGKVALYSAELEAAGHDPLPSYEAARESPAGDPDLAARFPLVLLTTKSHTRFLNTSYSHLPKHGPLEGGPVLELCPHDAAARGIADGDQVRVFNDRGELTVPARLSDRLRPGVVSTPFGWWMAASPSGTVANSLTNDALSDWGGGVAYHDTLVEVARL